MQPIYNLTGVDMRRADQAGSSRGTTVGKLVLPPIKFKTISQTAGIMDVDYAIPVIEALEPKVMLNGVDLDILGGFGEVERWTFAASWRKRPGITEIAMRVILEGVWVEWEPDDLSPGDFKGCNHVMKEITHYELTMDGKERWYIDHNTQEIRKNGKSLTADRRRALGN